MRNVLILGHGEIGKSIERLYEGKDFKVYWKDLDASSEGIETLYKEDLEVMHVCIPFNEESDFYLSVSETYMEYEPKLVIINSTVPIGTTNELHLTGIENIVHSPVMGVHPNLTEAIRTFTKIVGADGASSFNLAEKHFEELGIKTLPFTSSRDSEAAKLLSTSYYNWCIQFMRGVHELCEANDLDYESVYRFTNEIYNEGYEKIGMGFVRRPILKFVPGKTGGHCQIPNWELLKKYNDFKLAHIALELEKDAAR